MNVKNCKKCGRIFNYVAGRPICPACKEELEKTFQIVKSFIQEHKQAPITEVAETCEVDIKQIKEWVREERLCFTEDSPMGIECEGCGTTIKTGYYCDKCKNELVHGFKESIKPVEKEKPDPKTQEKTAAAMRFLKM